MIVPVNVDVPMERWPWANWGLMLATTVVSFVAFPSMFGMQPIETWMLYGGGEWRSDLGLIGSVMTHGDLLHLLGNMVFLFVFGNAVNAKLGHAMFLAVYFLLGAVSGLVSSWASDVPGLGASGAIFGIAGMFFVLYPKNHVSVFYFFWIGFRVLAGTWSIPTWVVIGAYVALDVVNLVIEQSSGVSSGVGLVAHLSGAAAGFGLAVVLLLTDRIRATMAEETLVESLGWR
ncbi:MAG: rhomboid family intramembrane serine protease [Planctomycetota bacterium]